MAENLLVVTEIKKALREAVLSKRNSIPAAVREKKDRFIQESLKGLEEYRKAETVMLFASFRTEVDTASIIRDALKSNKRVVLPKVDTEKKELRLYYITGIDELKSGFMGIPEPEGDEEREVHLKELEFIMMPGVAFDERGGRLGYGGGYYDRLLSRLKSRPPLVAVAYEEQIVNEVPLTDHDVRVDKIVTDKRVITCLSVKR